jgi:anaerobic magnesium-protoporphyrin IX monomethyl ester cyclase
MTKIYLLYFDLHTGYYPSLNHGLAYIIGILRNENHKVTLSHLIDEKDFNNAIKVLEKEEPDLIGLSFTTNQTKYVRSFLKMARLSAKLKIAGGVHCTMVREEVFEEFPEIDGICIGEGEIPLKELSQRLERNEDYLSTSSFYFRTKDGIIRNPIAPLRDIEDLPLPDYSPFNYHKIIADSGGCFPMMLSRGCPYNCHYCCNHAVRGIYPNNGQYVRFPSVQHSIKIIKKNLLLYPKTRKIAFADDTFTLNRKWLLSFCRIYKKEVGLPFLCNARVENIDDEVAQCLKVAGCISIDFGVETGNEWLRNYVLNRKHSNKKIKEAFKIAKGYGIRRFSFNIVGLPFETKEMARDTLDLNLELQPNLGKCFYFYPYPGTRLRELCADYGLLLDGLESVSGYLEAPSIKEVFMSHREMKKYFELMQSFFYARLIFSRMGIPFLLLERILLRMVFLLRRPISIFLNPTSDNKVIVGLRKILRKLAMKYLR